MGVTVKDILDLPAYSEAKLLAGEDGLDRLVKKVDIIEVPDVSEWITEGVMYITAGYAFKDDPLHFLNLIRALVDKGAAALALKVDRFIKTLPEGTIKYADEMGFPLIHIPSSTPYIDLTVPVLTQILGRQTFILERVSQVHAKLTQVVLDGGDLAAVANSLANSLGNPVLIEDLNFDLLAASIPPAAENYFSPHQVEVNRTRNVFEHLEVKGIIRRIKENLTPVVWQDAPGSSYPKRIIAPIVYQRALQGYVTLLEVKELVLDLAELALEQAATVAALVMEKRRAVEGAKARIRYDVLQDLLFGNFDSSELMLQRANYVDWDLSRELVVIALDIDHFKETLKAYANENTVLAIKSRLVKAVEEVALRYDAKAIVSSRSDSVVLLTVLSGPRHSFKSRTLEIARAIKENVDNKVREVKVTVGIGGICEELSDIPRSYKEARQALRIGKTLTGGNQVFHIDDLELYKLLVDSVDPSRLREYSANTIGPLIEYDREKSGHLCETLEKYLELGGNQTDAARALFIHRNTLSYRINRIKSVLKVDLDDPEVRLKLLMALRVQRFF